MYNKLTIFEEKTVVVAALNRLRKELSTAMFYKDEIRVKDLTTRMATLNAVNVDLDNQILKEYGYTNANGTVRSAIRPNIDIVKNSSRHLKLVTTDTDGAE